MKLYISLFLTIMLFACQRVMDKKDLGQISTDDIWASPALADAYFNRTMSEGIPGYESDLMGHTEEGFAGSSIVTDVVPVENNVGGNVDRWSYGTIRKINRFLENIDKSAGVPDKDKADYKAQMYTLRAFLYFEMVRVYGGVPLSYHTLTPGDDELALPRAKTSVCIDSIISDLDKAIAIVDFPMKRDAAVAGRITKAVAYALKGRVLLTYASPQFAKETPAGTKSSQERWNAAYDACKEAQNKLSQAGYGLYRANPATPQEAIQNYYTMFVDNECSEEIIWVRRYAPEPAFATPGRGANGETGYPTLEMALAFANADGTPYTDITMPPASAVPDVPVERSYTPYWLDREPRFYAAIAYNGCDFPLVRNNQVAVSQDLENGKMKHFWMLKRSVVPAADAQQWDGINSFRIRKRFDLNINYSGQPNAQYTNQSAGTDYPLIRYAEVVLNLAEAAAKTGKEPEALDLVYSVRKRAGIPAGGDGSYGIGRPGGNALIAAILNERLVELCFEGFRFHDVRRWRLYTDDLVAGAATIREGKKLNGLVRHDMTSDALNDDGSTMPVTDHIEKVYKPLAAAGFNINTQAGADLYFTKFRNDIAQHETEAAKFAFSEREYFFRIPYELHIKANPNIAQTNGWTDSRGAGTFNPYE